MPPEEPDKFQDVQKLKPLHFVTRLPFLSQRKHAILQLVAKYSVIDPAQLTGHTFDFLDPQHSLHPLFERYKLQYQLILDGARPDEGDVLHRAISRAHQSIDLNRPKSKPRTDSGSSDTQVSISDGDYAAIDWQDFVVLESVEFFSSDFNGKSNLSAPFTKEELRLQKHRDERFSSSDLLFKSAITGELVPASQYNEHIRILTLDPKSRLQKHKEIERSANSNLEFSNVAENLAALRQKRRRLLEEQ